MEKVSIPIKTRIAICWIIVSSGLLLCYGLYPLIEEVYINFMIFREFRIPEITLTESGTAFALIFLVTPGLVLLSCAILLLKRKKNRLLLCFSYSFHRPFIRDFRVD